MKVLGEAEDAASLFKLLEKGEWDIIVLDINMPGKSGIEALKELQISHPRLPVLILSMYGEEQYGLRSIKAGAAGYLKKVSAPNELVTAIRKIVGGSKYISPLLGESLAETLGGNSLQSHSNLSDREFEVLCKIASGKSAEQIAEELYISVHTVYSYRARILEKMHMKSSVELTKYAVQNNLL
jgi:DNA-binding NarL/FixJ family response regulator